MTTLAETVSDSVTITRRNLIKVKRVPDLIVFATLSPIMFVLLFRYVFGGAINVPGGVSYAEFLLPGIFAQTVIFGSTITGASIADDLQKGLIDRFRSLPMSRSAVLIGRTVADLGLNALSILVMALTGLAVGWRINTSVGEAAAGFLILLVFAYAISWLMAMVGLLVRTPEVVNNASFIVIFPITFVANTFVPLESFPAVLRTFAEWNPVSTVVQAARELFGNIPAGAPEPEAWSLQHPVAYTLLWAAVILAVFVPLSVRAYLRTASR
ncbi:MAG: ABC-type polysaccharide/polyol phosphate export system, permease component [Modestobacter sp.]|jgi:ABC-2 type transport system permease protein|nr:ABC-type polysaccharide/polyol phosphate export system, permease component [Modestobacter sp.]MCW2574084.1 ABC-type polysaccharide/polyol phosphate export system, permease component [Modestobacter sp.]MCW2617768.1 ABC-type polysaccharide/polyol phosphate export system, permease component [Modestobacter sp.]